MRNPVAKRHHKKYCGETTADYDVAHSICVLYAVRPFGHEKSR